MRTPCELQVNPACLAAACGLQRSVGAQHMPHRYRCNRGYLAPPIILAGKADVAAYKDASSAEVRPSASGHDGRIRDVCSGIT